MMRKILFACWSLLLGFGPARGQTSTPAKIPAIGGWRDHLPYHQAIGLAAGTDVLYCATPYSIFSVDPSDKSIQRLSKTNGLSGTGMAAICYDPENTMLTVAYTNSNIDMVSGDQHYNIPVIRDVPLTADKTIYAAMAYSGRVYLSSGLGIIVLDEVKHEVKDTYIIGTDGDTVAVQAVATDGTSFYAATSEGLKRAAAESADLADYHSWTLLSGQRGLGPGICKEVAFFGGRILALQQDSIYIQQPDSSWNLLYAADGWTINDMTVSDGKLLLSQQQGNTGRVAVVGTDGTVARVLATGLRNPRQALTLAGEIWVADSVSGLMAFNESTGEGPESYIPNSPLSAGIGDMAIGDGALWVAAGGLSWMKDGEWTNFADTGLTVVAVNPRDSSVWAGTDLQGLLRRQPGDLYTHQPFGSAGGMVADAEGNLWVTNNGAAQELTLRPPDGSWHPFTIPFSITGNTAGQIITDDNKQLWLVSPGGNGVLCYSPGALLTDFSDDQWRYYRAGTGQGNLPDNNVNCIAKDKSGFIWIGTANGIGVVQCAQSVFKAGGCDAVWPVVQFDNFAGYLFSGQKVQTIAIDGADRKWIGTNNGVWLISADAQKIIFHFTADSTPLLSNDVRRIVVDPQTGEVFFSTASGICSFRSTATEGGQQNENVLVFPNPVPPGYTGTIAIRGLVGGAIVKITALDGRLVYQTNALGGQAIWNGKDYRGRQVQTGVYLVLVSDLERKEKMVTKIVFIGK